MKKLMLCISLSALALCACSEAEHKFKSDPQDYGLFLATTNIFANSDLVVEETKTGKIYQIKVWHVAAGDATGYAMASLPAGRYELATYSPDSRTNYPIATANGWFEVQNNCFNYGGHYDFEIGEDGMPVYTNSNKLEDIENLPHHYRDMAEGHDICSATMGHESERLNAADVAKVMPDL